jgi:transposase
MKLVLKVDKQIRNSGYNQGIKTRSVSTMKRKSYSREYKEYVCKLIEEEGRKVNDLCFELELPRSSVSKWVKDYRGHHPSSQPDYVTPSELEKMKKRHENELQSLREENEILKKAMHIFTKDQE